MIKKSNTFGRNPVFVDKEIKSSVEEIHFLLITSLALNVVTGHQPASCKVHCCHLRWMYKRHPIVKVFHILAAFIWLWWLNILLLTDWWGWISKSKCLNQYKRFLTDFWFASISWENASPWWWSKEQWTPCPLPPGTCHFGLIKYNLGWSNIISNV